MKIIICQPQDDYFIWQLRVQMQNFREHGLEKNAVILLAYDGVNASRTALEFKRSTKAEVIFIKDTRKRPVAYGPSVVPHLMAKYFWQFTNHEPFYYLGADCLFVDPPDLPNQKRVYLASANSISSRYLKGRGEGLFLWLCNDAGIDPLLVEANDKNAGGAQHFFNVVPDPEYWVENEVVSYKLFNRINEWNFRNPKSRVQAWTAGMWALLWCLWKRGIETETRPELAHSWPSFGLEKLDHYNFFHNAGVTEKRPDLFFKGKYIERLPTAEDLLTVDPRYCSWWYVEQVRKALHL